MPNAVTNAPPASSDIKEYSRFAGAMSWRLSELGFRLKAAHGLLLNAESYDETDIDCLGADFILTTISKEVEALALELSQSEFAYTLKAKAAC